MADDLPNVDHAHQSSRTGRRQRIHFVTGRLAEFALRKELARLGPLVEFEYTVDVLPITVAALMSPDWIARHIRVPAETDRIVLPGYCQGDLTKLTQRVAQSAARSASIEFGPRDLRKLWKHFGVDGKRAEDYGRYDIEIIAEINHAPRVSAHEILAQAKRLKRDGADLIDVGCVPGETWAGVADCVRMLVSEGFRVSIDSLNPTEIAAATAAGAELVLSVNATNREYAADWGCEVVVIPDKFENLEGLHETLELLSAARVPLRIDPILEPIGCGFARSLQRYLAVRDRYPDAELMMGIGNLTELTEVDSAGINVLLLGFCQELAIRSVLTTQVINWARSSVRECDIARRLVHYAVDHKIPPKHIEPQLVLLRDPETTAFGAEALAQLAAQIRDKNYRIFAEENSLHLLGSGVHLADADPFALFDKLMETGPANIDASHAFYLGYEMCKAMLALQLGKEYRQDEALNWGYLTVEEKDRHRLQKSNLKTRKNSALSDEPASADE